ncbi:MAG: dihydrodipicolinate synthase family protein [Anaerolineaceae bacterium]|nr:dihydrodipicolinate synthase family protein [Anaerolineaceae bacterium]
MSWRGIFPIVVTPFRDDLELDEQGLADLVEFCIANGAAGLVGPANASEFTMLDDGERLRWLEIVCATAAGRIPVVATVNAGHALPAARLAQRAAALGAGGIMALPPYVVHPDAAGCYDFFKALAAATCLPVIVQNYIAPVGTPMSADLMARMCREIERVDYIKEETTPASRQVSRTIAAAGEDCRGVFGGQGGVYMLDEHRRGAVGNMPACQAIDLHCEIWRLLDDGDEAGARALFNRLLPLINYERQYGVTLYKAVLQRRGVLRSSACRHPMGALDAEDLAELDALLEGLF